MKTLATVGRGPGFASRNAIGGMWNGYLAGAKAGHFNRGRQMMATEHRARKRVLKEIRKTDGIVPRTELEGRIRDAVQEEFTAKWGAEQGGELFEALEAFYDRNLLMGSRTDDLYMQTYGGAPVTRDAGGPMGDGFDPGAASELPAWQRFNWWERNKSSGTLGGIVNDMDPAMRRMAGFDQTVFTGSTRDDIFDVAEGASRTERTGRSVQRQVQRLTDNPWVRANAGLAETSEKYLRLGTFLSGVDQYGLHDGGLAAGLLVKGTQFDYADLSEFERRILRNVLPFYTWTRKNVPLQIRGVMSSPDKLAKFNIAWGHAQETMGDEDFPDGILPEYVRANLGFATNFSPSDTPGASFLENVPGVGRMFDNDYQLALNMGALPLADLENLFRTGAGVRNVGPINTDEVVSMLNPLLKVGAELGMGVDSFTREELRDRETAPDWMQGDWAALLPGFYNREGEIVVSGPGAHAARTLVPPVGQVERLTGSTGRYEDRLLTSWMSQFGGVPASTLDDNQLYWNARRLEQELERENPNEAGTWDTLRRMLGGE